MGTYRIARPLPPASLLFETSVGVSDAGKPVLVHRLKDPWTQAPGFLDRFAPWQRGWQSLKDTECVVGFIEAGLSGTTPCVVVELSEAEPLRAALRSSAATGQPPLSLVESLGIVLQATRGLLALERLTPGIVHGDVSAATLMLGADGAVRLDAVGLASATPADPTHGPARSELLTMAPEEVEGQRTSRTDVFRLGLVWLELLTGKPAFMGGSYAEVKGRFENFPGVTAAHFPSLPPNIAAVLASMLARAPGSRPSVSDLELLLTQLFESVGGTFASQLIGPAFPRLYPGRTPFAEALASTGGPLITISGPSVKLGRIATKKVTADDVAAAREAEAVAAARAAAKDWATRHARDEHNPKDFSLGQVLLEQRKVPLAKVDEALAHTQALGGTLFEAFCAVGGVDEDEVLSVAAGLGRQAFLTGRQLLELELGPAQAFLPRDVAEEWNALPLKLEAGGLTVAVLDPSRADILDDIKRRAKARSVTGVRATERTIREGLARIYDGKTTPPDWARPAAGSAPADPAFGPVGFDLSTEDEPPFHAQAGFAPAPPAPRPPPSAPVAPPAARPSAPAAAAATRPSAAPVRPPAASPALPPSPYANALGTAPRSAPSAPVPAPSPSSPARATPEVAAPPPSAPRTAAALAGSLDVALRLFDALLATSGERGLEGAAMCTLARSVAKQAGATGAPLDQVRLSVAALVVASLLEGKHAFEVPSRPATAASLGPHWPDFEDFVRPLLDGGDPLPTDPRGVLLCLVFEVATELGAVPKNLADTAPVLDKLRARYPAAALASLEIVLASSVG